MGFIRRWFWIGALVFGLGGWNARLEYTVGAKAEKADYTDIKRDLLELKAQVQDLHDRQQQFMCDDKPKWCR